MKCRENKSDTFISCCLSLGAVQNARKKFEMALNSYKTASQVAKQLGYKEYQLEALESLGIVFTQLERFSDGKKVFQQAYRDLRNNLSCDITNIRRQLMRGKLVLRICMFILCFHSYQIATVTGEDPVGG